MSRMYVEKEDEHHVVVPFVSNTGKSVVCHGETVAGVVDQVEDRDLDSRLPCHLAEAPDRHELRSVRTDVDLRDAQRALAAGS